MQNGGLPPVPAEKWGNHVVLLVHVDGSSYVADVGLGEGPTQVFPLEEGAWEDRGFRFMLERRPEGCWRWQNDAVHSGLPGMHFDTSSSAASCSEFWDYHEWYWTDESSPYVRSGVVIHRHSPRGLLSLHSCTLRRTHPDLPRGHEVVATVTTRGAWFELLEEVFSIPNTVKILADLGLRLCIQETSSGRLGGIHLLERPPTPNVLGLLA
ncbi:unnamed protein product [Prorocentrum cordatum]|uniref:Arylamine N-acetyltransferase n=2 Tax=Prorocentrum cordatum TaxID=2364126 RepID=A0ABN9UGP7_9DINO|nr:unnamed protein product [Polarella glacialis]